MRTTKDQIDRIEKLFTKRSERYQAARYLVGSPEHERFKASVVRWHTEWEQLHAKLKEEEAYEAQLKFKEDWKNELALLDRFLNWFSYKTRHISR